MQLFKVYGQGLAVADRAITNVPVMSVALRAVA